MGNSFKKIESNIDTVNTIDTLGWKDTQIQLDTVDSLGWNDTVNTIESLGWKDTAINDSEDDEKKMDYEENDEKNEDTATSSPFISTELYKKIMEGGDRSESSLSLGKDFDDSSSSSDSEHSDSSTSTDELADILSLSDYNKPSKQKSQTGSSIEAYGFSNTSSELSHNFVINSDTSISNSIINKDSSSINTSDINLVSIDKSDINIVSANSVNGKRFI